MSTLYPNTTQVPNLVLDKYMPLLSDSELRVYLFAIRQIMGWVEHQATRRAHIPLSCFVGGDHCSDGCGLSEPAIKKALKALVQFGLLKKIGTPTQAGQEWELVFDESEIDHTGLIERRDTKKAKNKKRTAAATEASIQQRNGDAPVDSDETPISEPQASPTKPSQPDASHTKANGSTMKKPSKTQPQHQEGGPSHVPPGGVVTRTPQGGRRTDPLEEPSHVPPGGVVTRTPRVHYINQSLNQSLNQGSSSSSVVVNTGEDVTSAKPDDDDDDIPRIQDETIFEELQNQLIQENIGQDTPLVRRKLREFIDSYGEPAVRDAIEKASLNGQVNRWAYFETVLADPDNGKNGAGQPSTQDQADALFAKNFEGWKQLAIEKGRVNPEDDEWLEKAKDLFFIDVDAASRDKGWWKESEWGKFVCP